MNKSYMTETNDSTETLQEFDIVTINKFKVKDGVKNEVYPILIIKQMPKIVKSENNLTALLGQPN